MWWVQNQKYPLQFSFRVSGFGFWVRVSGFGFRVLGLGLMGYRRLALVHTALVLLDLVQPPQNLFVARVLSGCGVEHLRASFQIEWLRERIFIGLMASDRKLEGVQRRLEMTELRVQKYLTIHDVQAVSVWFRDCPFPTARHSITTFVVNPKILLGPRRGHPANQKTRLCLDFGFNSI